MDSHRRGGIDTQAFLKDPRIPVLRHSSPFAAPFLNCDDNLKAMQKELPMEHWSM